MNRDRPSRRAVAIPQCRPLAQASPPQAPQPPCLRSTPPWTTTWVCSSLLSLCRKTCLLWLPTIHRLVALYSLSVSFVGRLFSFNCCAVCLRVCVCRFAQLTCSQDRELSTPSDRWLPTFYSVLITHYYVQSDDHIIFQSNHNSASCLDVWQSGPKISMLRKEKQREKKWFPNDLPEKYVIGGLVQKDFGDSLQGSKRSCK